jgi:imidazoleglycerol phosphate dehydratase HisB
MIDQKVEFGHILEVSVRVDFFDHLLTVEYNTSQVSLAIPFYLFFKMGEIETKFLEHFFDSSRYHFKGILLWYDEEVF